MIFTGVETLNTVNESFYNTSEDMVNGTSIHLYGLEPYSVYEVTVRAVNGFGPSDEAVTTGRTQEDGEMIILNLSCSHFRIYTANRNT